jgi:hypothetical protein
MLSYADVWAIVNRWRIEMRVTRLRNLALAPICWAESYAWPRIVDQIEVLYRELVDGDGTLPGVGGVRGTKSKLQSFVS